MSPDEVATFLDECRSLSMCTVNADGSVHAVAMWYGLVDGQIVVQTKAKSQKIRNLVRNPRLTVLVDAGEKYEELRGVELVGRAELITDADQLWAIGVAVYERNTGPYSEAVRPAIERTLNKRVGVRLDVERTVSWDHRKLSGLGATH